MVDDDEFEIDSVWQPPDPSTWDDARYERATALVAYTDKADEKFKNEEEVPDYDW